jgi:predicted RNA polymerase sigma factor
VALLQLDTLAGDLAGYHLLDASRATMLRRGARDVGRIMDDAIAEVKKATKIAPSDKPFVYDEAWRNIINTGLGREKEANHAFDLAIELVPGAREGGFLDRQRGARHRR